MEIGPHPNYKDILWGQQGWICPKCGRVYGPGFFECTHCNNQITEASTTSKDSSGHIVKDDSYTYADSTSISTISYDNRRDYEAKWMTARFKHKL